MDPRLSLFRTAGIPLSIAHTQASWWTGKTIEESKTMRQLQAGQILWFTLKV